MSTPTPASSNKYAVLADNMDLDGDTQGVSASIHAPPTFASVVSGAATAAPVEHTQTVHDNQVGCAPHSWKPLPCYLRFRKQPKETAAAPHAEPSVGNKRPFGLVGEVADANSPSKRTTPSAADHPATVLAPQVSVPALQPQLPSSPEPATVLPLVASSALHAPAYHASATTPQGATPSTPSNVHLTLDPDEDVIHGMLVDHAPATQGWAHNTYTPPDNARVLPPPHGGFPAIEGLEQGLLSFVHNQTIERWRMRGGASTLVYIAGDGLTADFSTRIKAIASFFSSVFPAFPAPTIGPPELFKRNDKQFAFKPVFPFFISGSEDLINTLTSRVCWPTPSITLFVASMDPEASHFAIAITGFPLDRSDASDLVVADAVREAISNDATARTFITNNTDNLVGVHPDHYIDHVLNSIVVRSCSVMEEGSSVVVFNVYITPPTEVPDRLKAWIVNLKKLKYSCFHGAGRCRTAFYCDVCKGRDHPTSLCRFTALIGWPTSPAFTNEANSAPPTFGVSRGGPRGRGGRGNATRGRRGR